MKDHKYLNNRRFNIGDYVHTMYEGIFCYGSIKEYCDKTYKILLDDGRELTIHETSYCVKANPSKY